MKMKFSCLCSLARKIALSLKRTFYDRSQGQIMAEYELMIISTRDFSLKPPTPNSL